MSQKRIVTVPSVGKGSGSDGEAGEAGEEGEEAWAGGGAVGAAAGAAGGVEGGVGGGVTTRVPGPRRRCLRISRRMSRPSAARSIGSAGGMVTGGTPGTAS